MRPSPRFFLILLLTVSGASLVGGVGGADFIQDASAQEAPRMGDAVYLVAEPENTVLRVPERSSGEFRIRVADMSLPVRDPAPNVLIDCDVTANTTDYFNWGFTRRGKPILGQGDEGYVTVVISTGVRPSPEFFTVDVICRGRGIADNRVVGEFSLTAQVEEYTYFGMLTPGVPGKVRPEGTFRQEVEIVNNGLRDKTFRGEVVVPEGWRAVYPDHVFVPAGERETFVIQGMAPRGDLWYSYESALFRVEYWPADDPGMSQSRFIPAQVHGLYIHPALAPLIILAVVSVVMLGVLVVYARRTVEEQVLGKPIPPWRIPVEREYLKRLEQEDPDEYYIVRYHLMEEEHQSALLWYKHFKHRTRKDRKLERDWLKKKDKVKGRTATLRGRQERLENRMARRLRVLPVRRRRRLAHLENKVLARHWREQRRLLKVHKKGVKRIDKIHQANRKRAEKEQKSQYDKECKRVEKQNKKLIRQGEVPLPLPPEPVLEYPDPELPEVVEVPLSPVKESVLALQAQRINGWYSKRISWRTKRAKKRMRKKGAKREKKASRLKKRLPSTPSTHLYDQDEFVSEDQVVVEDSRPLLQRALNIPTLEERESLRRRKSVYRIRIKQAAERKDDPEVERLKRQWQEEKERILGLDAESRATRAKRRHNEAAPGSKSGGRTPEQTTVQETDGRLGILSRRRKGRDDGHEDTPAAREGDKRHQDPGE